MADKDVITDLQRAIRHLEQRLGNLSKESGAAVTKLEKRVAKLEAAIRQIRV